MVISFARHAGMAAICIIALANSTPLLAQGRNTQPRQKRSPGHAETLARQTILDAPAPLRFVEQMPAFQGDLGQWMTAHLHYPDSARVHSIQGKCQVQFIVAGNGKITDAMVVSSSGNAYLDGEALRVVKLMPNWKAGRHQGKPVDVFFTLPITFTLD